MEVILHPDGRPLMFGMPTQCKPVRYYSYNNYQYIKKVSDKADRKEMLPKLSFLRRDGSNRLAALDFDELPTMFESWADFAKFAEENIQEAGVVMRSASNRLKVLIPVDWPEWTPLSIKCKFLKSYTCKYLGEFFLPYLDLSQSNFSHTFVSSHMLPKIKEIKNIQPVKFDIIKSNTIKFGEFEMRDIGVPEAFTEWVGASEPRALFVRFLLSIRNFETKGFDLSTTYIGEFCGVSKMSIHRFIKHFLKMGWLVCTRSQFIPGVIARRYKPSGLLLNCLKSDNSKSYVISFEEGGYNRAAYLMSKLKKYENNAILYLEDAKQIPKVFDKKGRFEHFLNMYNKLSRSENENRQPQGH